MTKQNIGDLQSGNLAQCLKALRLARGFSLGQLALRAGVDKATLSRWESTRRQPSIPELEATLLALDAPPQTRREFLQMLAGSGAPRALSLLGIERRDAAEKAGFPSVLLRDGMPGAGSLLRALRLRRGLSQEQVGFHLQKHLSTISAWERGDAWPKPDVLHALCQWLEATPDETLFLQACFSGSAQVEGKPQEWEAVDALEMQFRLHLVHIDTVSELYPARDLAFIALERGLWEHGVRRPSVRPLLAEVYAHHGNYLRNMARFAEGSTMAEKSLALIRQVTGNRTNLPEWTHRAVVCVADGAAKSASRPQPARGEAILRQWLSDQSVSVPNTAWLYRKLSDYQFSQGRYDEAAASLHASKTLSKHTSQWGEGLSSLEANQVEVQRFMADQLLRQGRGDAARGWLPEGVEPNPLNRLRDYLLWAKASLQTGRKAEAQAWVERAYAEIETNRLPHRRADFERIAVQL